MELRRVPSTKLVFGYSSGSGPTHLWSNLRLESLESLLTAWVDSEPCELRGWKIEFLFLDSNPYTKSNQISLSPSFALYSWQRKATEHNLHFFMNNMSLMLASFECFMHQSLVQCNQMIRKWKCKASHSEQNTTQIT